MLVQRLTVTLCARFDLIIAILAVTWIKRSVTVKFGARVTATTAFTELASTACEAGCQPDSVRVSEDRDE